MRIYGITIEEAKSLLGDVVYEHYAPNKLLYVVSIGVDKAMFEKLPDRYDLKFIDGVDKKGELVRLPANFISGRLSDLIKDHEKKLATHRKALTSILTRAREEEWNTRAMPAPTPPTTSSKSTKASSSTSAPKSASEGSGT